MTTKKWQPRNPYWNKVYTSAYPMFQSCFLSDFSPQADKATKFLIYQISDISDNFLGIFCWTTSCCWWFHENYFGINFGRFDGQFLHFLYWFWRIFGHVKSCQNLDLYLHVLDKNWTRLTSLKWYYHSSEIVQKQYFLIFRPLIKDTWSGYQLSNLKKS